MGISRDLLAKWEHGTKAPTITDLGNMAQICRKRAWKELEEDFLQLQREILAKMPAWKPTRLRGHGPTLPDLLRDKPLGHTPNAVAVNTD